MPHPALVPGAVAVITGGASGIGLATAKKLAARGLRVVIADRSEVNVEQDNIVSRVCDVSKRDDVIELEAFVTERFGGTDVLMNNAGISPSTNIMGGIDEWQTLLGVNLWGVIHGTQVFLPNMLERGRPGLIINTGSKQGITTPPGNPAYNVSKAGVKAFTEALEHELRNTKDAKIRAHLLIPGFVFTGLTARGRTEKPEGAWTAEQTADFMLEKIERGDFYILCPDNEVSRELDEKRIMWAAGDLVENRPPLSRWHPDYAEAFKAYLAEKRQ